MDEIEPSVSRVHLASWLIEKGYAEGLPGYGHATGYEVADALLDEFDIRWRGRDAE